MANKSRVVWLVCASMVMLSMVVMSPTVEASWQTKIGNPGMEPGGVGDLLVGKKGILYAGGIFTKAGGNSANSIAKWNGSDWLALGEGLDDNYVKGLAIDDTGNLYACGGPNINNGFVAKWNGSKWTTIGVADDGFVHTIALDGAGNLYAGGYFTTIDGVAAKHVAKWNGSSWSALGDGLESDESSDEGGPVHDLAVDKAGNLYAGGGFERSGVMEMKNIAKWNGSSWSQVGGGLRDWVQTLLMDDTDNLYVGGDFDRTRSGMLVNHIVKWDGSTWTALGSGLEGGDDSTVQSLALDSAGNLFAGGKFTTAGGVAANNIAKWNGSAWSALGSGVKDGVDDIGAGADPSVRGLAVSGDNLYVGGNFTTAGDKNSNFIALWQFPINIVPINYLLLNKE